MAVCVMMRIIRIFSLSGCFSGIILFNSDRIQADKENVERRSDGNGILMVKIYSHILKMDTTLFQVCLNQAKQACTETTELVLNNK